MSSQWYYYAGSEQTGPVSDQGLRDAVLDGRLQPNDYVWKAELGDQWVEARTVPGLFAPPPIAKAGEPPPVPGQPAAVRDIGETWPPSCWRSARRAWAYTRAVLFNPFDMGKWFVLGFSAWLTTFGRGGSVTQMGFNALESMNPEGNRSPAILAEQVRQAFAEHVHLVLAVGAVIFVFLLVVGVILLWLNCRGRFMFLDNVVNSRAAVAGPWRRFRAHGNSLFVWSLVYGVVVLALLSVLGVVTAHTLVLPYAAAGHGGGLLGAFIANTMLWVLLLAAQAYIQLFLNAFVVPIMYNDDLTATEAWSKFGRLFAQRTGYFVWFGICYALWMLVVMLGILLAIPATCCLLLCPLSFPYVDAVALLPASVFLRCLGLEYLAQFGDAYCMRADALDP